MGGLQVRGGEPEENKRLRREILDLGWLSVNAAASGRKRVEKKAGGEISHFFAGECTERGSRVKGLRCAPMNAPRTRALDSSPSPLCFASRHRKNVRKKWGARAQARTAG
jgi:hypothetical protein